MKKSKLSLSLLVMAVSFVTVNTFAGTPPPGVPDAGCSALLLSIGFAGLAAARKLVR